MEATSKAHILLTKNPCCMKKIKEVYHTVMLPHSKANYTVKQKIGWFAMSSSSTPLAVSLFYYDLWNSVILHHCSEKADRVRKRNRIFEF